MSAGITTDSVSQNDAPSDPEAGLWPEIRSTYAKLKGMQELETQALFTRDSKRLDAKARAAYKSLDADIQMPAGDLQMIADDITLDEAAREDIFKRLDDEEMGDVRIVADNITFTGGGSKPAPEPTPPAAEPAAVQAPVPTTAPEKSSGVSPLMASLATAGVLVSGIGIPVSYYLGRQQEPTQAVAPEIVDTDTNTRGVLELVPEEGQRPEPN